MAAATIGSRYTAVLGPIKMEIVQVTSYASLDTVVATMQRPLFGAFVPNVNGGDGTLVTTSDRTLTLTNTGVTADAGLLLIFGF